jgi:hypothetical protein
VASIPNRHAACDHRAVDTIPITDQVAWSLVPRECLADLASNPLGSGICGERQPRPGEELLRKLGPEFAALADGMQSVDLSSQDVREIGSIIGNLSEYCK